MAGNVMIKVEVVVDGEWVQQGPPTSKAEFLKVNEELDPIYKAQTARMQHGDVLEWNMGTDGVWRLTVVHDRSDRFTWGDGDLALAS